MKLLLFLGLLWAGLGQATSPYELEGLYKLDEGKNCPLLIELITFGLDDLTVFDRETNENGKEFIRFSNINLGVQSQTYGQFSEKACYKTVYKDGKLETYGKGGLSVFRPCFTTRLEVEKSAILIGNQLKLLKYNNTCSYKKEE